MNLKELELLKSTLRAELKEITKEIEVRAEDLTKISQEISDALFVRKSVLEEIELERSEVRKEHGQVLQEKKELDQLRADLAVKEQHHGEETRKEAEVLAKLRNEAHTLTLSIEALGIKECEVLGRIRGYEKRLDYEKDTETRIKEGEKKLDEVRKELADCERSLDKIKGEAEQRAREAEDRAQIAEIREKSAKESLQQHIYDLDKKMKDWLILRQRLETVYKKHYPELELPL